MQKRLLSALSEPLDSIFDTGGPETWSSIRRLLKCETDAIVSDFSSAVVGFDLDQATVNKMVHNLKESAIQLVERKAREEASKILIRMKDRFAS